ncbi:MAG: AAA family ATPase [Candidatus Micrarchaeota archaeon]
MDETLFSNIVSASARSIETARVGSLRETSMEIAGKIKAKKGLYVICGLRGVGKTTILAEISASAGKSICLNGEIILKYGADLLDMLHHSERAGYSTFMVDEIHALPNWEKDIKIFYDETHHNTVITGSSAAALKVRGSELSRRATVFNLEPLSFREYLYFKTGKQFKRIRMEDLLDREKLPVIVKQITPHTGDFELYTRRNALPAAYFEDNPAVYLNIVERTVRYDLQSLHEMDAQYIDAAFKAIKFVATSSPGDVSYSGLASSIRSSTRVVQEMIRLLSYSGLFYIVPPEGAGHKAVRSEDKILMPLSFRSALCGSYGVSPSTGGIREDFFIQHVKSAKYLKTGVERRTPDFLVGDCIFEIGGASKGWAQLKERSNAYLVKESLLFQEKEIPLYAFGFLY